MKNEILNMEWHTCDLVVKALNKSKTKVEAVGRLGISDRTLYRLMNVYRIKYDNFLKKYTSYNIPKYELYEASA